MLDPSGVGGVYLPGFMLHLHHFALVCSSLFFTSIYLGFSIDLHLACFLRSTRVTLFSSSFLPSAFFLQPSSFSFLPSAFFLQLSSFSFLPSAFFLQLSSFSFLPTSFFLRLSSSVSISAHSLFCLSCLSFYFVSYSGPRSI
jgi:hypothetical protein